MILAADGLSQYFIGYRHRTLLVVADNEQYASSEEAQAAEVVGHISDLGGAQREYFDLKEGEPVLRENGVEPDAAPHLSEFEGQ